MNLGAEFPLQYPALSLSHGDHDDKGPESRGRGGGGGGAAPESSPERDEATSARDLSEQQRVRREKLSRLQAEGRDPFAVVKFDQKQHSAEIKSAFETYENEEVSVAGRMMSFRDIGKASFIDLQDRDGRIQVYVNADDLGAEDYGRVKTYDHGDIIGVEGSRVQDAPRRDLRAREEGDPPHEVHRAPARKVPRPSRTPRSATAAATSTSS